MTLRTGVRSPVTVQVHGRLCGHNILLTAGCEKSRLLHTMVHTSNPSTWGKEAEDHGVTVILGFTEFKVSQGYLRSYLKQTSKQTNTKEPSSGTGWMKLRGRTL